MTEEGNMPAIGACFEELAEAEGHGYQYCCEINAADLTFHKTVYICYSNTIDNSEKCRCDKVG